MNYFIAVVHASVDPIILKANYAATLIKLRVKKITTTTNLFFMKKLLSFVFILSVCNLYVSGYPGTATPFPVKFQNGTVENFSRPLNPAENDKYAYAELVHQRNYGIASHWVSGNTVSEEIRKAVAASKVRHEALDILGNDGWELITTVTRNFDGGFEIFFYFRKKIN